MPRLAVDHDGVVAVVDAVGDQAIGIELLALLIEVGDLDAGAPPDGPGVRRQLLCQELQQRRLAGSVRTDEADAVAAHDAVGEVPHDRYPVEGFGDTVSLEHQPS